MEASRTDVIVIAAAKAKPGKVTDLERALGEAGAATRTQPGCVQFSLYRSSADPSVVVGFERWASEADHQRHLQGTHIQKLVGPFADILAEPPNIVSYVVVDE